jgi:hypothetical protein
MCIHDAMARQVVKYEDIAESSRNGHAQTMNGSTGTSVKSTNGKQPHWTEDGKPISASAARRYRRVLQLLATGDIVDAELLLTKMETAYRNVEVKEALAWAKRKADAVSVVDENFNGEEVSSDSGNSADEIGGDGDEEVYEEEDDELHEDMALPDPTGINIIPAQPRNTSARDDAWDDSALIDAWDAALEEYNYFDAQRSASQRKRSLDEAADGQATAKRSRTDDGAELATPFVPKKHSTLWHAAPTTRKSNDESTTNVELAKHKAKALSLLDQVDQSEDTPATPTTTTTTTKRVIKGVRPPSSHISGNPAWLSACAVVSKTPNEIGEGVSPTAHASEHMGITDPNPSSSSTSHGQDDVLQNLAMAWYYAGYYQAMALSQMQK